MIIIIITIINFNVNTLINIVIININIIIVINFITTSIIKAIYRQAATHRCS